MIEEKIRRKCFIFCIIYKFQVKQGVDAQQNLINGNRFNPTQLIESAKFPTTLSRARNFNFTLPLGAFVLIPYTEMENQQCKFLLRIFTESENEIIR